ncbi:response regulator [Paenibacillus piscarius]|uniref:response regulator n=1 Tax=Paenibacillus piscarius TaxID=1089681 RepID=UPI001EE89C51|nr:response regulator [Paenibacillus piscarius]
MFRVLLVDDEVYVRKGLLELIPWESLSFCVAGEADNGAQALELMEAVRPDLVITDIRMPTLDGLELIRRLREQGHAELIFMVISGFNDFQYAQQALRYGVHDYLLKPIDEEEMTAALRKLSYALGRKRIAAQNNEDLTTSAIMEALVQDILQPEEAHPYAVALGLEEECCFIYAVCEVYAAAPDKRATLKVFQEALYSLDAGGPGIPVLEQQPGVFGMLLCTSRIGGEGKGLKQPLEQLRGGLAGRLKAEVGLYAGEAVESLAYVHRSYEQANEAVKHKYAEPAGVILYGQIREQPLYVFDLNPVLTAKLILELEEGRLEACRQTVEGIFTLFREQRFTPQAVSGSLSRCMTGILGVVKEMDGTEEEMLRLKALAEADLGQWSLQMLQEQFLLAISEAAVYIAQLRKQNSLGGIKPVKQYIDTHYHENISLKSIAAGFYMNAVYLGRLFRKTYGVYFNEYLLELRIREAKKLLRQSDLRMYEIAGRVGFQNSDYFVTQFEKLEQQTPSEYRNMLIGGNNGAGR